MQPPAFVLPVSDDDEDPAFLSAIDAVEADGLRRLSHGHDGLDPPSRKHDRTPSSHQPSESFASGLPQQSSSLHLDEETAASKRPKSGPEGEYLAALRGNHSKTWQALNSKMGDTAVMPPGYGRASYAKSGAGSQSLGNATRIEGDTGVGRGCYHCGMEGHWAKDCPTMSSGSWGSRSKESDGGPPVPDRNCPCGGGTCKVLIANTEKNAGRRFYKCPLRTEEGQCAFFEWCDAGSTDMSTTIGGGKGDRYKPSELTCPCGTGSCIILTAKTEKNLGRQFYRCPLNQGEGSCGFFKWCDENTPASTGPSFVARATEKAVPLSSGSGRTVQSDQLGSGSLGTCYKCGQAGHWSKDCSNPQSGHSNRGAGMGSCYKCGSEDHFARDCPNAGGVGGNRFGSGTGAVSGSCFTCGEEGHWSPNCPNAGSKGFSIGRGTSTGSCYKCGAQGHWSSDCPDSANTRQSSFAGQFRGSPSKTKLGGKTGGTRNCYKCGEVGHWANECRGNSAGNKGRGNY